MNEYPYIFVSILNDAKASGQKRLSLVDAIWQYDGRNRLMPMLSELNNALKEFKGIRIIREGKELFLKFDKESTETVMVNEEEFKWAQKEYHKRFWIKYKKEVKSV